MKDIVYAKYGDRELKLDLYLPDQPKGLVPAILCVVGGGWRSTDKAGYTEPGKGLAAAGFVAAAITYRSTIDTIAPGNVYDCKAGVRWLRANAGKYGIDPQRIGALGGSAGGHLVAMLGTTNGRQDLEGDGGNPRQSSAVQAVCDFCGPTDLTLGAQPALREKYKLLYECEDAYLGSPAAERMELAKLVSPLFHVSRATTPTLIVHGDRDDIVPLDESVRFHEALKKNGVPTELRVVKGGTHDLYWKDHGHEVVAFFRKTLERK